MSSRNERRPDDDDYLYDLFFSAGLSKTRPSREGWRRRRPSTILSSAGNCESSDLVVYMYYYTVVLPLLSAFAWRPSKASSLMLLRCSKPLLLLLLLTHSLTHSLQSYSSSDSASNTKVAVFYTVRRPRWLSSASRPRPSPFLRCRRTLLLSCSVTRWHRIAMHAHRCCRAHSSIEHWAYVGWFM